MLQNPVGLGLIDFEPAVRAAGEPARKLADAKILPVRPRLPTLGFP
jgi:hypothetical protein